MEDTKLDNLEAFWNSILSREPDQVKGAFERLSEVEQQTVVDHLQRMSEEPGWHPEQRSSAKAALDALQGKR